jgi:hypothetical protein
MAIVPDTTDWTWVLERPCPECGFDSASVAPAEVAAGIRAAADRWAAILREPPGALRLRARDDRWSTLEYACHVRDVFVLFDRRLGLMLTQDDPTFANWDQDATALDERYDEQDPVAVAAALAAAAAGLAADFNAVQGEAWDRRGSRSDGATFTVASFARYLLHDPVHHLYDVTAEPAPDQQP